MTGNFEAITQVFQNVVFMEVLRERWAEIKKLQSKPALVATIPQNPYNLPE